MNDSHQTAPPTRAVVVTGHSSGIGAAAATLLATQGWLVFGLSRTTNQALPSSVEQIATDVSDWQSVADAATHVHQRLEAAGVQLAGIVNCAGQAELGLLIDGEPHGLEACLSVNAVGPVRVVAAFTDLLTKSRGRVVNVGSGSSRSERALNGAYPASKLALESLTATLGHELKPHGVAVCLVVPGPTASKFGEQVTRSLRSATERTPPALLAPFQAQVDALTGADRSGFDSPSAAAAVIVEALTDPEPRRRYFVGRRARAQWCAGLIPAGLTERAAAFRRR